MLTCAVCNKKYAHLGSHVYHAHGMLAREYKERFGLPYNMGLVTAAIARKQREHNRKGRSYENFKATGTRYHFRKGHTGQRRISEHERRVIVERIEQVNARKARRMQQCPVCRMKFHHVESHMYQAHKLVRVNLPKKETL